MCNLNLQYTDGNIKGNLKLEILSPSMIRNGNRLMNEVFNNPERRLTEKRVDMKSIELGELLIDTPELEISEETLRLIDDGFEKKKEDAVKAALSKQTSK